MERLNLTGNAVEGEGALYFARMLLDNEYIQELVCLFYFILSYFILSYLILSYLILFYFVLLK